MWVGAGNSVTVAQWLSDNAAISLHLNVDRSFFWKLLWWDLRFIYLSNRQISISPRNLVFYTSNMFQQTMALQDTPMYGSGGKGTRFTILL